MLGTLTTKERMERRDIQREWRANLLALLSLRLLFAFKANSWMSMIRLSCILMFSSELHSRRRRAQVE